MVIYDKTKSRPRKREKFVEKNRMRRVAKGRNPGGQAVVMPV